MTANGSVIQEESPAAAGTAPLPGARTALALLLAINLFNFIDRQVLSAVLPDVQKTLFPAGGDNIDFLMGLLTTAFMVSYMAFAPVFGWFADRTSRWWLVGIGVIVWSLASGASGLAETWLMMFLTRCLVGIGEAAYGPAAPTILSDLYPVQRRGQIMAWFYVAVPVGSALGYILGGQATTLTGDWRVGFFLVVPWGLLLGAFCFFMPEPRRGHADRTTGHKAEWRDYLMLAHTPSFVFANLGYTAQTFAVGGIGAWIVKYVVVQREVPNANGEVQTTFGLILVVSGLTATLAGGYVADLLRPRLRGAYFWVCAVSSLLAFPLFLAALYVPFPAAWFLIFLTCFGLFFCTGPINTILANVTHPSMRATGFAVNIFIIHALGDVISPPIMGAVSDAYGSMQPSFLLVSGMILVCAVLWACGARYLERDTALAPTRLGH